jgi:hypothetical protein
MSGILSTQGCQSFREQMAAGSDRRTVKRGGKRLRE